MKKYYSFILAFFLTLPACIDEQRLCFRVGDCFKFYIPDGIINCIEQKNIDSLYSEYINYLIDPLYNSCNLQEARDDIGTENYKRITRFQSTAIEDSIKILQIQALHRYPSFIWCTHEDKTEPVHYPQ